MPGSSSAAPRTWSQAEDRTDRLTPDDLAGPVHTRRQDRADMRRAPSSRLEPNHGEHHEQGAEHHGREGARVDRIAHITLRSALGRRYASQGEARA